MDEWKTLLLFIVCLNTCDAWDCRSVDIQSDVEAIRKILEQNEKKSLSECECRVDNTVRDNEPTQH